MPALDKCKVIAQAFQVDTNAPKRITLANKELECIDKFNYLRVLITANGTDLKVTCQLRVGAVIKISAYFEKVRYSGTGYPPTIVRKYFIHLCHLD